MLYLNQRDEKSVCMRQKMKNSCVWRSLRKGGDKHWQVEFFHLTKEISFDIQICMLCIEGSTLKHLCIRLYISLINILCAGSKNKNKYKLKTGVQTNTNTHTESEFLASKEINLLIESFIDLPFYRLNQNHFAVMMTLIMMMMMMMMIVIWWWWRRWWWWWWWYQWLLLKWYNYDDDDDDDRKEGCEWAVGSADAHHWAECDQTASCFLVRVRRRMTRVMRRRMERRRRTRMEEF